MEPASLPAMTIDDALKAGHTLIVPAPRLTRILKQRLGLWQDKTARVWRTPPVLTTEQWIDQQLKEWRLLGAWQSPLPERLDELAERTIWEQVLEQCEGHDVLLDRDACAKLAMETWQLVMRWAIPVDTDGIHEEEWVRFCQWLALFRSRCDRDDVADAAVWLQAFMRALADAPVPVPQQPLVLVGFVEFTAIEAELFSALAAKGVQLLQAGMPQEAQQVPVSRVVCESPDAEWQAAAEWAQQYLQDHPGTQVAVLVNELNQHHQRIGHTFDAVFHPHALLQPHEDIDRRYNMAVGNALVDYPVIRTVMHWLLWLARPERPLSREWITTALLLPFCNGSDSEYCQRARFDAWSRRKGNARLTLAALRAELADWMSGDHAEEGANAPQLAAMLDALLALPKPKQLTEGITGMLDALGWPGERPLLLSEQRTVNAFYKQLEAADKTRRWLPKGFSAQLHWFRRHLRDTLHQHSGSDNAPVQVLGLIDAVGRRFDAVWVANLTASNWPAQSRPNPLIPQVWQHRLPHANSQREREYAEQLMAQIHGLAGSVIVSHARAEGDDERQPSPLTATIAAQEVAPARAMGLVGRVQAISAGTGHAQDNVFANPWLEWFADPQGLPIPDDERQHVRGGTGLFKAQAFCPLAGWAKRALAVKRLDTPDDDLDAAERGTLIHSALEYFWQQVKDQASLLALQPAERQHWVAQAVNHAMQVYEREHLPLPERYRQLELQRLQQWLSEWLLQEAPDVRAAFSVEACEQSVKMHFEGFTIYTFIDRIDTLPDGRQLIIDYKTGDVSPDKWLGERLFDPQLPLYVQSRDNTAGALFAILRGKEKTWRGVVSDGGIFHQGPHITGDPKLGKKFAAFENWEALQQFWRERLTALANEIATGDARPEVFDDTQLKWCEVRLLLRKPEVDQQKQHYEESLLAQGKSS